MQQNHVEPIPKRLRSLTPYLTTKNADQAIEFYKKVFDASLVNPPFRDNNGKIGYAELKVGDSIFMLMDESTSKSAKSPESIGGTPVGLALFVEDADSTFRRAVDAGAKAIQPVEKQFYGDRSGKIEDPFGHRWSISTHVEDLSMEEMKRRIASVDNTITS